MSESNAKIAGLVILSAVMLGFSYLFYTSDGVPLSFILLFIGIVLALTLASRVLATSKARSKRRR